MVISLRTSRQYESGRNAKAERSLSNDHLDCPAMSDPTPVSQHLNITYCDDELYQGVLYEVTHYLYD